MVTSKLVCVFVFAYAKSQFSRDAAQLLQMLNNIAQNVWTSYVKHEHISEDPTFIKFVPRLISSTKKTLLKVTLSSLDLNYLKRIHIIH